MKIINNIKLLMPVAVLISATAQAQSVQIGYDFNNQNPNATTNHASVIAHSVKLYEEAETNPGQYAEIPLNYTFDSRSNPIGGGMTSATTSYSEQARYLSISITVRPGWKIDKRSFQMTLDHTSQTNEYELLWTMVNAGVTAQHSSHVGVSGGTNPWNLDDTLLYPIALTNNDYFYEGRTLEFILAASSIDDHRDIKNLQIDNVRIAYNATMVPEPSSSALLGLGFLGLVIRRRR